MWILRSTNSNMEFIILVGNEYSVGRKDCHLTLHDDMTISRRHALLWATAANVNRGEESALHIKDVSKLGTELASGRISNGAQRKLNHSDVIVFGAAGLSRFEVLRKDWVVTTSCLQIGAKKELRSSLLRLGGEVVSDWTDKCEFVVMETILITAKVVCALLSEKHIITPKYFMDLLCSVDTKTKKPNPTDYLPPFGPDEQIKMENVSLGPDIVRKSIFLGKEFVFLSETQYKRLIPVIQLGSAHFKLIAANNQLLVDLQTLKCDSSIVIMPDQSELLNMVQLVNDVVKFLKRENLRVIMEAEIGYAVIYNSLSTFCNPRESIINSTGSSSILQSQFSTIMQDQNSTKIASQNYAIAQTKHSDVILNQSSIVTSEETSTIVSHHALASFTNPGDCLNDVGFMVDDVKRKSDSCEGGGAKRKSDSWDREGAKKIKLGEEKANLVAQVEKLHGLSLNVQILVPDTQNKELPPIDQTSSVLLMVIENTQDENYPTCCGQSTVEYAHTQIEVSDSAKQRDTLSHDIHVDTMGVSNVADTDTNNLNKANDVVTVINDSFEDDDLNVDDLLDSVNKTNNMNINTNKNTNININTKTLTSDITDHQLDLNNDKLYSINSKGLNSGINSLNIINGKSNIFNINANDDETYVEVNYSDYNKKQANKFCGNESFNIFVSSNGQIQHDKDSLIHNNAGLNRTNHYSNLNVNLNANMFLKGDWCNVENLSSHKDLSFKVVKDQPMNVVVVEKRNLLRTNCASNDKTAKDGVNIEPAVNYKKFKCKIPSTNLPRIIGCSALVAHNNKSIPEDLFSRFLNSNNHKTKSRDADIEIVKTCFKKYKK